MNKNLLLILLLYLFPQALKAQDTPISVIAFYNLENLFDTEDDPEINDEEYLPEGKNEWTEERYQAKLANMAKVISTMTQGPDIVGVVEVENRKVLEDLVATEGLARKQYGIVHFNSPDRRGIDVALLYRSNKFIPFETKLIPFEHPDGIEYFTRDMLWVKGLYFGDTLNVVVNHWPSRRNGGVQERNAAASILRRHVDSVQALNPAAKIVIMGDFNDDPTDKSIKKSLNANWKKNKLEPGELYNTSASTFKDGFGTLFYRGAWNLFDQIIISQSLIKDSGSSFYYIPDSFKVYAPEWMREPDGQNQGAPLRTYSYGKYQNGFSDHYPTFIVIGK